MGIFVDNNELAEIKEVGAAYVPVSAHVRQTVTRYLLNMQDHDVVNLHAMVMGEVEKPLLEATLEHVGHNQTRAAKALGLSRSTLRKKMDQYGLS